MHGGSPTIPRRERTGRGGDGDGGPERRGGHGEALRDRYSRVSPYFVPRILTNMAAGQISMKYSFEGPNTQCPACATVPTWWDAFRFIRAGRWM
ncbi:3-oxoacyl-[acyl-carrier-protein] synthase-like 2 [Homarus americanus]|uniref:3-oxoacyl-[acyl-carrier-protein] synthase-like 2 n=1 Tax=Homarus americanus TaxID=6706 RepID=A0A8J5MYG8_HOMAM|nr:3-oxoacyl-[acyl-carrier-protein] synthase-like 2 [Homarus americanus]